MSLQIIAAELRALPWAFLALQAEVALFCVVAYQWGKRRGLNLRAEAWKQRADELQFQLVQAEERLAAEKRITLRQDTIISQFTKNGGERLRLVESKGGR